MKKRDKNITAAPAPRPGPSLLEFWRALKGGASVAVASGAAQESGPAAASAAAASQSAPVSPAAPAPGRTAAQAPAPITPDTASPPSGRFSSGGSGGPGGGGYGLGLIVPDPASQERIRTIMKVLCEKDAKRKRT